MQKRSLGRGLSDLLSASSNAVPTRAIIEVSIGELRPNPYQPRGSFDPDHIDDLAASIRVQGILQPILVREGPEGYQIVAGERRWRAASIAGLSVVPCIISDFDEMQMLEVALIENLQRDDLNPMDEALAFARLREDFGLTQEDLAASLGKSRSAIANCLRLLDLPVEVQDAVSDGRLSEGHARALLMLKDERGLVLRTCEQVIEQGLSVRQTEEIARNLSDLVDTPVAARAHTVARQDPHVAAAAERLQGALATKVSIAAKPGAGGTIRIAFHDVEELTRIIEAIAPEVDF